MTNGKQDIGLSLLTASAVFGAWSAWNSSLFTSATFVDDEEKLKNAHLAMNLGAATGIATGVGVYYIYGSKGIYAAASAFATTAVLYYAYERKLRQNPKLQLVYQKMAQEREYKRMRAMEEQYYTNNNNTRNDNSRNGLNKIALLDILGHAMWLI